jgi:hypothetical protein
MLFALTHSRFYARQHKLYPSQLCYADKLAITVLPKRVFLTLARASGELDEYLARTTDPNGKYARENQSGASVDEWHSRMIAFVREFVEREKTPRNP